MTLRRFEVLRHLLGLAVSTLGSSGEALSLTLATVAAHALHDVRGCGHQSLRRRQPLADLVALQSQNHVHQTGVEVLVLGVELVVRAFEPLDGQFHAHFFTRLFLGLLGQGRVTGDADLTLFHPNLGHHGSGLLGFAVEHQLGVLLFEGLDFTLKLVVVGVAVHRLEL